MLNGPRVSEMCAANVEDLRREPDGGYSLVVRLLRRRVQELVARRKDASTRLGRGVVAG